jgi:lysophospholipase L1-like esterase
VNNGLRAWRRLVPIGVLLCLVLTGAARAEVARIMPLGDSITYGFWGYGDTRSADLITGYRQALFLALQKAGHQIELVGTLSAGGAATPSFNPRHEGHGGWRDDQVADKVFDWLTAHPADIVLLHIGTNSLDSSPADVERILDEIDRFSPDTIVLLARIINRKTYSSLTRLFNDNVEAMARERIRNGDRIVLVNMEDALDYSKDMNDLLHPNQTGYEKMAKVWLAPLLELLPLPTPPRLLPMPTIHAWVDKELRLQLRATGSPAPDFSLRNPPTGMTINQQSGLLTWRPGKEEIRTVTVQAQNVGGSDRLDLQLKVREAPLCPEGTAAVWPLDEEIAPFFELFHRTPAGSCAGNCPAPVAGRIGDGQAFDRGDGIGLATGGQAPAESFSLSFWLRHAAMLRGSEHLLGARSSSNHWTVELTGGGLPRIGWQSAGEEAVQVEGTSALDDGDWHHLLLAFDAAAGQMRLYVDGEEEGSASGLTGSSAISLLQLALASSAEAADFAGDLDEVALFAEALPASDAELLYARGAAGLGVCRHRQELPKITSTPSLHGIVGRDWTYQVTATGLPQPTFTLLQNPAGMSLSVESGRLSWTPTSAGTFTVTLRASNMNGQAEQTFTLDIEPPPAPPAFRSTAPGRVVVGEEYAYSVVIDGYPSPQMALVQAPEGMVLNNDLLSWTAMAIGSYAVTLRGVNASGHAEQSFTIEVEPPPAPPAIDSIPKLVATAGLPYLYQVRVSGYPRPQLLLLTAPDGMHANGEQLSWTPAAPGFYLVILEGRNEIGRTEQSFMIQVLPAPQAPRILSVPPLTATVGQSYSHWVQSEGYPPPEITLVTAPPGMTLDAEHRLHWRPTAAGHYPVHLRAQSSSGIAEQNFTLQVAAQRAWHGRLDDWWRKFKKRWRKWF